MNHFKRKRNRIENFDYSACYAYFVTICTINKLTSFKDEEVVKSTLEILDQEAERFNYLIYAYCFMPDHLHLLLINNGEKNLAEFIKLFKQKTGFYYKREHGISLWQKSYFDHVLRKKENINDVAAYIYCNPVRAKIVDDFRSYPYLGSRAIEVEDFYKQFQNLGSFDIHYLLKRKMEA